jgi:hypothetical protein
MYRESLGRIKAGQPASYPVRDMVVVSAIQIAASDLARTDERSMAVPDWISLTAEEDRVSGGHPHYELQATSWDGTVSP